MRYEHPMRATAPQSDSRFSVLSTLVALVIACPSLAAAPPTKVGGDPQSIATTTSNAVDRTHKGDRLIPAGATFAARWNIQDASVGSDLRPARSERPTERQMKAKIPFGCDPAFGPLVHANFSGRCLARVGGRAKLAALKRAFA
jgi:hypothetical protein